MCSPRSGLNRSLRLCPSTSSSNLTCRPEEALCSTLCHAQIRTPGRATSRQSPPAPARLLFLSYLLFLFRAGFCRGVSFLPSALRLLLGENGLVAFGKPLGLCQLDANDAHGCTSLRATCRPDIAAIMD